MLFGKGSIDNARDLKRFIDDYCVASGKMVNFSKSSIYFSAENNKQNIPDVVVVFRMNYARDLRKYFSLLYIWGDPERRH